MKILKTNKAWLKGGISFLFLDILLLTYLTIILKPWIDIEGMAIGLAITQIPISWLLLDVISISSFLNLVPLYILGLINWFIIGSIIGWIIGMIFQKIKSYK